MVCGSVTPLFALARGYCDQKSTLLQQTLLRTFLPSTWEEKNSARGHVSFTNSSWWPLLPALGILTVAENFVSCKKQCGHIELQHGVGAGASEGQHSSVSRLRQKVE